MFIVKGNIFPVGSSEFYHQTIDQCDRGNICRKRWILGTLDHNTVLSARGVFKEYARNRAVITYELLRTLGSKSMRPNTNTLKGYKFTSVVGMKGNEHTHRVARRPSRQKEVQACEPQAVRFTEQGAPGRPIRILDHVCRRREQA